MPKLTKEENKIIKYLAERQLTDVKNLIKEVQTMKIKHCIWCGVAKPTAELLPNTYKCKKRNLLGNIIRKHVFRVKNKNSKIKK